MTERPSWAMTQVAKDCRRTVLTALALCMLALPVALSASGIQANVRLVSGKVGGAPTTWVEVYRSKKWVPICGSTHFYDDTVALQICKKLGFKYGWAVPSLSLVTSKVARLDCYDTDDNGNPLPDYTCDVVVGDWVSTCMQNFERAPKASVQCSNDGNSPPAPPPPSPPPPNPPLARNAKVRLVRGQTASQGIVEINYAGGWGTICDLSSTFNENEACAVCRSLGYLEGGVPQDPFLYDPLPPSRSVMLDVMCGATATSLADCSFVYFSSGDVCREGDQQRPAVAVECKGKKVSAKPPPTPPPPKKPPVRKPPSKRKMM